MRIEWGVIGTDAEVVASLGFAICVDGVGGIDSGGEDGTICGVVGAPFFWEGLEVSECVRDLSEVIGSGVGVGSAGMADFFEDVRADACDEVKGSSDLTVGSLGCESEISRRFEEVRSRGSERTREVVGAKCVEHLEDMGLQVEGDSSVGFAGDSDSAVLGSNGVVSHWSVAAIAGIKGRFEVSEVVWSGREDLAIINYHTHYGFALRVARVNLSVNLVFYRCFREAGEGDWVEASAGEGLSEVSREDSIRLFETVEAANHFHPLASKGVREVVLHFDDYLFAVGCRAWEAALKECFLKIEVGVDELIESFICDSLGEEGCNKASE